VNVNDTVQKDPGVRSLAHVTVADPDSMHELGKRLGMQLKAGDLVLLTGPLGAGKTTLTRGIGDGLNIRGPVTSPTFVLARTHPNLAEGPALVHVDAYRLHDSGELEDLDLDFERAVVIAEWGDGLIDPGDTWLHITVSRPDGEEAAGATDSDSTESTSDPAAWAESDWDEELIEPRELLFVGYGSRWTDLSIFHTEQTEQC
jgi:tRNA threonylcarbamoyladenosine biosynthesis protein TsaE